MPPIKSTIVVQHGTLQIFNIFLPHLFTGDWIVTPASQSPTPQIYGDCIKSCGFVSNGPQNTFVSLDMTDRKGHLVHTFPRPRCPTSCMYLVRMYMSTRAHQSIHPPIGIFPHTFHLDCIVRFVLHMSASPYRDFIHPAPQTFFSALPSISHPRRSHSPTIVEVFSTLSKD